MDELEFRRLLDLFPVVRSRDFVAESESSRQSTSRSSENEGIKDWQDAWEEGDSNKGLDQHDAFWRKLKLAAERKVGAAEAERFCETFQRIHSKLVNEELSPDAAQNFLKFSKNPN
ncbi:hypothetical protein UlMin_012754 [Ulmus minor]